MLKYASESEAGAFRLDAFAGEASVARTCIASIAPIIAANDASRNVLREWTRSRADIALAGDVGAKNLEPAIHAPPLLDWNYPSAKF